MYLVRLPKTNKHSYNLKNYIFIIYKNVIYSKRFVIKLTIDLMLYLRQFSVSSVSSGQSGLISQTRSKGMHVMLSEHKKCESAGHPLSVMPVKYSEKKKT